MSFYMPGVDGPVITTFGWFLNKANPLLREEIIKRLVTLQTTDKKPKNINSLYESLITTFYIIA